MRSIVATIHDNYIVVVLSRWLVFKCFDKTIQFFKVVIDFLFKRPKKCCALCKAILDDCRVLRDFIDCDMHILICLCFSFNWIATCIHEYLVLHICLCLTFINSDICNVLAHAIDIAYQLVDFFVLTCCSINIFFIAVELYSLSLLFRCSLHNILRAFNFLVNASTATARGLFFICIDHYGFFIIIHNSFPSIFSDKVIQQPINIVNIGKEIIILIIFVTTIPKKRV